MQLPETRAELLQKLRVQGCDSPLPASISDGNIEIFIVPRSAVLSRTKPELPALQSQQKQQCDRMGITPDCLPVGAVNAQFVVRRSMSTVYVAQGDRDITCTFSLDKAYATRMATRALHLQQHGANTTMRGDAPTEVHPTTMIRW